MRLDQYIAESKDMIPYDIIKMVYDNSLPYIKEYLKLFRSPNKYSMLWSGRGKNNIVVDIVKIRKNRKPKDTPEDLHEIIDDIFNDIFGSRYRSNAVFVTGDMNIAANYANNPNNIYAIFPTGEYTFVWSSNIKDLWMDVLENFETDDPNNSNDDSELWGIINTNYEEGSLKYAIQSGNEIMVSGKSYVMVRRDSVGYVVAYMQKYGSSKPTPEKFDEVMKTFDIHNYRY